MLNADALGGQAGELLSHNVFAYCKNNAVNNYDPNGFRHMLLGNVSNNNNNIIDTIIETVIDVTDTVLDYYELNKDKFPKIPFLNEIAYIKGFVDTLFDDNLTRTQKWQKIKIDFISNFLNATANVGSLLLIYESIASVAIIGTGPAIVFVGVGVGLVYEINKLTDKAKKHYYNEYKIK